MANELFSKSIGVYVNTAASGSPAAWKLAVCTSSKSLSVSVATTEINNDCTGGFVQNLPSTASWTMSFEGDVSTAPGVNEISAEGLFDMVILREEKQFKFATANNTTYLRYGKGIITQFDETATTPDYQTFSVTITGTGPIDDAEPA
jgi:hypothetical protein